MKNIFWIIVIVVAAGLGWYFFGRVSATEISTDTHFDDGYMLEASERLDVVGGAVLTFDGSATIAGEINGDESGVMIVAKGDFTLADSGSITGDGNVQIVGDEESLLRTDEAVDEAFAEAGEDSGDGPRVGPIVPSAGGVAEAVGSWNPKHVTLADKTMALLTSNTETAHAQDAEEAPDTVTTLSGKIDLSKEDSDDPKKRKKIVLISFPPSAGKVQMNLKNLNLIGPQNAPSGTDDLLQSCDAKGGKGADGLRLRATAWGIDINNITIGLTKGGDGGDAETKEDCDPGTAVGGEGGDSGNMKFTAAGRLVISGAFHIIPGRAGNGGSATAYGKDAEEKGGKGGDATATGGKGADNNKKLAIEGTVVGTDNITVDELFGGNGGVASADGGDGADNEGCGAKGGDGGTAKSTGGKGGNASLTVFGSPSPVFDVGGNGGNADATGGFGGNGGNCDAKGAGGNGGKGGSASADGGKPGTGDTNGTEGTPTSTGGNGGNGGDGCTEGKGGKGGSGDVVGSDGVDGKNLCVVEEKKKETSVGGGGDPIAAPKTSMSFAHVKPGEYSEVYMDITGEPGTAVSATLTGPAVEQGKASGTIGSNGKTRLTWRIYQYGPYKASGTAGGTAISGSVNVN